MRLSAENSKDLRIIRGMNGEVHLNLVAYKNSAMVDSASSRKQITTDSLMRSLYSRI